ncbi:hypothetical protein H5399_05295 [Tessaracoccus sp. MC1627]|uniref:hypothetical protein n=1 Tax=Tessaracoccus sp. MC1627 TaxID=2760312 RepID=UPI001601A744|nr:hypothetical protein [Tessaracoccus sp. MC1627]MBB1512020.1 hypothetical protein [Tessaracoccus sp. MC1627]
MITAIEYRLQCDNGADCAARHRRRDVDEADWQVIPARSGAIARDQAKKVGWVRRGVKLPGGLREVRDLCPECAAKP